MTANTAKEFTPGRMVVSTMDPGSMESNTEKEFTDKLMVKRGRDCGKKERESNGLMKLMFRLTEPQVKTQCEDSTLTKAKD